MVVSWREKEGVGGFITCSDSSDVAQQIRSSFRNGKSRVKSAPLCCRCDHNGISASVDKTMLGFRADISR